MDLFELLLQAGLVTTALVAYLIFFRRSSPIKLKGYYRQPGWNYYFRELIARFAVKRWKCKRPVSTILETPREDQHEGWDCVSIRATAPDGTAVYLSIRKLHEKPALAEVTVSVKLLDGTTYRLPQHPETLVGLWQDVPNAWSAGGLKIEVLQPEKRLRILYNGLLKRDGDVVDQHVKFNFIWASASKPSRYPEDWSTELAAKALALEPWRDGDWPSILGYRDDGSWLQWGAMQGRFESYNDEGAPERSEYVRMRGVRERSWAPRGARGLRRGFTLTAAARDGTALMLRGFSYKDVLTVGYSGCVMFPDNSVHSITDTDLVMANFCEHPDHICDSYTINVSTKRRNLTVVLRINHDRGSVLSGVPYQQLVLYRTTVADIDGYPGTGLLELAYHTEKAGPSVKVPRVSLRWAQEAEVGTVGYCVGLDTSAAACPAYVGGKAASLALLASVQEHLGYKVPPGYALTTRALERHLEANPHITAAIREIEAANENYVEKNFREKCDRAVELFSKTEIVEEVRVEILSHLTVLRKKALEQNLGPEVRFAVRSSAVGEDSEALSAAGQNETVLGCASETDVLRGVQLCWGSMFAFTSAYYRRQNGQLCLCGGGVVVQALVRARAAGVLFTRAPPVAHPARLLLTANYGLGETVVSGSVEPDTIIVARGSELSIAKIEVGSKNQRVIVGDKDGGGVGGVGGVATESVTAEESKVPCVSVAEILALAAVGVAQEEAWGAPRDIEWAVTQDEIYLLQARPITALERWSDEELLHELDSPVMSDDDLITFANTGEVFPSPVTALTYDLVFEPLSGSLNTLFGAKPDSYDRNIIMTHYRCCMSMYNGFYRMPPAKLDLMTRVTELSISGNKIADENILSIARHRRAPSWYQRLTNFFYIFKFLITSKSAMKDAVMISKSLELDLEVDDPTTLLQSVEKKEALMVRTMTDHGITSGGSTVSQFIAMSVLAEGANDLTNEQCNEVNILLSSGGVLSAEVPQQLAKMARELQRSGKADEFRAQDPTDAMTWLRDHLPSVYDGVCQFMEKHGHRAVMEFDLITKPWALVPHKMMEVLQNMHVAAEEEKTSPKSDAEIIASLKTPKNSRTRKILRWLLPLCRRTVRYREITKAHLCLTIHKLRLALIRVGKLMVKQWYIPEEDLVFHFRLQELRDFLATRDPAILKKAMQRRQYHPQWCKLKFAELNTGWVEPLKGKAPALSSGDVTARGTVVCGGEVVARACVVKELSEIGQLQRGDILITHSTDIGWSPYFPLLSGIVTELGGLISHGAVIAREYGLPCIVGVTDATDIFKTGDTVRLAATQGLLEKVLLVENEIKHENDDQKST